LRGSRGLKGQGISVIRVIRVIRGLYAGLRQAALGWTGHLGLPLPQPFLAERLGRAVTAGRNLS
jgi:hypothetical protein